MKMSLRRRIVINSIAPVVILGLLMIAVVSASMKQVMFSQAETALKGTAAATLAAYDQNSGAYITSNGQVWKGSYNISTSSKLLDAVSEKSGMVVAFFYGEEVAMTSIKNENDERYFDMTLSDAVVSTVYEGGEAYFDESVDILGVTYFGYYMPVVQFPKGDPVVGTVFVGIEKDEIISNLIAVVAALAAIIVVVMVVCFFVARKLATGISRPLKRSVNVVKSVAAGKLHNEIDEKAAAREDDIGELTRAIDQLQGSLRDMISNINDSANLIEDASNSLDATAKDTAVSMENVKVALESITQGAEAQANDAQDASINVSNMGDMIVETGNMSKQLNDRADEMLKSSDNVSKSIVELKEISVEVENTVAMIADLTKQTNESVVSIRKATEFISGIASQTNLLSLNASIEAARAGEAGRGFAVVAGEISNLADQSNEASGQIGQTVNVLIENSTRVVEAMEQMQDVIKKQNDYIGSTEIRVNEVVDNLNASVEEIRKIEEHSRELDKARNSMIETISSLAAIAQENASNTATTNEVINTVSDEFDGVKTSAGNLRNTSKALSENIDMFEL